MSNVDAMSIDAFNASFHASNSSDFEENPADVTGMSLDDVDIYGKYNPEEVSTSVMLQEPVSEDDDDDDDEEFIPKDVEEVDELADDPELEAEPKLERGRPLGNKEEDLEIVRNIYGTEDPFYAGFTGVKKDYQKILDDVDRNDASMTDEEDENNVSDNEVDEQDETHLPAGDVVTINKLDLNDDDDNDNDYVPEE